MKTSSLSEYIKRNSERRYTHAKIVNSEMVFNVNGKWVNKQKFNELYPVYEYAKFNDKGANPDKTKIS
jgi:hypothetical protein